MRVTVIVPFHRNVAQLAASLSAIRRSVADAELIVAADGATEDYTAVATGNAARIVVVPGPSGPAIARNRAAAVATGDILVFVDTDVVVARDAIPGMRALLLGDPGVAGVFGAYDYHPPEPNFVSQFKNLSHVYVHEAGNPEAATFWAGLGAVRTSVFRAVGGFDERFVRPSVEDIDLGYRIRMGGHRLRLDPRFRGTHLKHWTLWNCVVTDIRARGVPWTQLVHRFKTLANDLNTSTALRLSVVIAYLLLMSIVAALFIPWALVLAAGCLLALVALNGNYYRWFALHRGLPFAIAVVPVHLLHHLCNGVSFIVGTVLHLAAGVGVRLPWTLPAGTWSSRLATAVPAPRTPS